MASFSLRGIAVTAALLALAACDNGPSAVAPKQEAAPDSPAAQPATGAPAGQVDHRKDTVKMVDGKPMWSASRKFSAEENAQRAFARNGAAFGARTLDEFVGKAHGFVDHPPKGTLSHVRANGDRLLYDPASNVFAVATPDGAPRTMFKPDEGRAYWDEQLAREDRRKSAQTAKRKASADGDA